MTHNEKDRLGVALGCARADPLIGAPSARGSPTSCMINRVAALSTRNDLRAAPRLRASGRQPDGAALSATSRQGARRATQGDPRSSPSREISAQLRWIATGKPVHRSDAEPSVLRGGSDGRHSRSATGGVLAPPVGAVAVSDTARAAVAARIEDHNRVSTGHSARSPDGLRAVADGKGCHGTATGHSAVRGKPPSC